MALFVFEHDFTMVYFKVAHVTSFYPIQYQHIIKDWVTNSVM